MRIKLPKIFKKKESSNPGNTDGRIGCVAKRILGFDKLNRGRFLKSMELNGEEVIIALTKLQTDLNWIKRIIWLIIAGSVASRFLGN